MVPGSRIELDASGVWDRHHPQVNCPALARSTERFGADPGKPGDRTKPPVLKYHRAESNRLIGLRRPGSHPCAVVCALEWRPWKDSNLLSRVRSPGSRPRARAGAGALGGDEGSRTLMTAVRERYLPVRSHPQVCRAHGGNRTRGLRDVGPAISPLIYARSRCGGASRTRTGISGLPNRNLPFGR